MKIAIICKVRLADLEYESKLRQYVEHLEAKGHTVHYPPRDTDQSARGIDICRQNGTAIWKADEIHVFYAGPSQGIHFDLGMAFAMNKAITIIENENYSEGKSFAKMIEEWKDEKKGL